MDRAMLRASFIYLVLVVTAVFSEEGNHCITPLNDPGICINIKRCEGLVNLLRTQSNNPEVRNYLLRSTCGYSGTVPLVCCPQIQSQFRTTTTNAPQTQPPPVVVTNPPTPPPVVTPGAQTYTLPRPPYCGISNGSLGKVVGGEPAKLGEFTWLVALGYKNKNNPEQPKWLCGGSLITEKHILTAGHCVHNRPDLYLARLGELDLYSDEDGASPVTIPLKRAKIHENYSPTSYTNDIAILTLERKPDTPTIWPVCIPQDNPLRSQTFEKYSGYVAGWGALYFNGPSSSWLQKALLPIVTIDKCKNAFVNFKTVIDERVICAGYTTGEKDACQGDSGGPLMLGRLENEQKLFYQIGVVSYGFKCAEAGYPGVYTRVTQFVDWIERNIN